MIATHGVKGDGRHLQGMDALCFGYFDHFAILVLATELASAMRKDRLVARRALGYALHLQVIMRAAHGRAALRVASFRIWHGELLSFSSLFG